MKTGHKKPCPKRNLPLNLVSVYVIPFSTMSSIVEQTSECEPRNTKTKELPLENEKRAKVPSVTSRAVKLSGCL